MTYRRLLIFILASLLLSASCSTEPESDNNNSADAAADIQNIDTRADDTGAVDAAADTRADDTDAADTRVDDTGADDAMDTADDADAPDTSGDLGALRLATWNVSYLDVPGGSDEAPREAEDYDLLRTYVARLQADVIAVQEVRGVAGTQTIFPDAEWMAECEDRNSSQNVCVVVCPLWADFNIPTVD